MGLGATVRVFDKSLSKLRRLQNNIGARVFTSVLQSDVLLHELKTSDVVIGAIHSNDGRSPMVVSEDMVMTMQPGSVIIDVSIDQGGCVETSEITTHDSPIIRIHDVVHYCVPNIPSRVSKTASLMMGNILTTLLIDAADFGGFENFLWVEKGLRNGIYAFNGSITNKYISQKFDLPYANLELLARTRF
jgi:alanine dehydrogenase